MAARGVALGLVLLASACSSDTVTTLDNTVATEAPAPPSTAAPTTAPPPTAAPTTLQAPPSTTPPSSATVTTPATATVIPTLPADPEIQAMADAALAAHDEYQRQVTGGGLDERRLRAVMTAEYVDEVVEQLRSLVREHRRFERGSINERAVLRIETFPNRDDLAHVVVCWQNNDASTTQRARQTPRMTD